MLRETLARNLRRTRISLGLTQEALAEECGLHQTYISDIERARRNVTLDVIQRLSIALDVKPEELLSD
ncbi:MAG: helix-turn-helix domain-containing protein [Gammaproteobacteria bacterium]|nr:helix-turn-helix domain-containing protein [Gammaproteobacteria bacterium]